MKLLLNIVQDIADGIEKSTVGALVMFGCFGCIIYLVLKEGGTEAVESLLTTAMIISATLLGVNSVTDIFKVNTTTTRASSIDSKTDTRIEVKSETHEKGTPG